MNRHAPEPWELRMEADQCVWSAHIRSGDTTVVSIKKRRPFSDAEVANAALIAAAPKLLAVAKALVTMLANPVDIRGQDTVADHLAALKEVIATAEGRS